MEEPAQEPTEGAPRPLPDRAPRSFLVHAAIDAVVAFGLILVVGVILGARWQAIVVAAVVLGFVAAPFTRRLEARQLSERRTRSH